MHVAVLDLGTNTFNLVIARKENHGFTIVHSSKLPVKLGEGGIHNGYIADAAFDRGIRAVHEHYTMIRKYRVEKILAFGTSALRSADNGPDFLEQVKSLTGVDIEIISGDREAELIYLGVRQTLEMDLTPCLILDIGGGSNEFIIANHEQIFWKKSFDLGIARLLEKFKPSDPITAEEIQKVEIYIDQALSELYRAAEKFKPNILLGASGSFETFAAMIRRENGVRETESALHPESMEIRLVEFDKLYNSLIVSTLEERRKMPGLEPMRIEMIVLAALFVKFIVAKLGIRQIIQSSFSLKEGAIYELTKQI